MGVATPIQGLFADYTVTASLSALEAFHYFGLPLQRHESVEHGSAGSAVLVVNDAGDDLDVHRQTPASAADALWAWDSPGLWAIVAIAGNGLFNLMGPKHTGSFAIAAAVGGGLLLLSATSGRGCCHSRGTIAPPLRSTPVTPPTRRCNSR